MKTTNNFFFSGYHDVLPLGKVISKLNLLNIDELALKHIHNNLDKNGEYVTTLDTFYPHMTGKEVHYSLKRLSDLKLISTKKKGDKLIIKTNDLSLIKKLYKLDIVPHFGTRKYKDPNPNYTIRIPTNTAINFCSRLTEKEKTTLIFLIGDTKESWKFEPRFQYWNHPDIPITPEEGYAIAKKFETMGILTFDEDGLIEFNEENLTALITGNGYIVYAGFENYYPDEEDYEYLKKRKKRRERAKLKKEKEWLEMVL